MYYKNDPRKNSSGYSDMTPYKALENIDSEKRFKTLLALIFRLCERYGFHLEERIVLKDKKTGKVWR